MTRWAVSSSSTPTRAPPARIEATSTASRRVMPAPSPATLARERKKPPPPSDTLQHSSLPRPLDVLAYLEGHTERPLEVAGLEREERLRPCDRLPDSGELVEVLGAQSGHRLAYPLGNCIGDARQPRPHDLRLALPRRILDPVIEAAALESIMELARAVRGHDHQRSALRPHRPELRNRDLKVGKELEEEGLELLPGRAKAGHRVDEGTRGLSWTAGAQPVSGAPGGPLERPPAEHARQVALVVGRGVQVAGRVGPLGSLVRGACDRVGV